MSEQRSKIVLEADASAAERVIQHLDNQIEQMRSRASSVNIGSAGGMRAAQALGLHAAGLQGARDAVSASATPGSASYRTPTNLQSAYQAAVTNARMAPAIHAAALSSIGVNSGAANIIASANRNTRGVLAPIHGFEEGAGTFASTAVDSADGSLSSMLSTRNYVGRFARGSMVALGQSASAYFGALAQEQMHGGYDIMGRARAGGSLFGGLLGAGVGSLFAGYGAVIGAGVGAQAGGMVSEWLAAPAYNAQMQRQSMYGLEGVFGDQWRRRTTAHGMRFRDIQDSVNPQLPADLRFGKNAQEWGAGWSSVSSGLIAGGMDPHHGASSNYVYGLSAVTDLSDAENYLRGRLPGGRTAALPALASGAIKMLGFGREQVGEMYTRRLATIYGTQVEKMANTVSPIFGTLPETGGNPLDILMKFGPEATGRYYRIQNEDLKPDAGLDLMSLSRSSAAIRSAQRSGAFAAVHVRGSAVGQMHSFAAQMEAMAAVPGGEKSLSYAQARGNYAASILSAYEEQDTTNYAIPMAHLEGMRDRAKLLPYAPGYNYQLALQGMGMRGAYLGQMRQRYDWLTKNNMISERDQLSMVQKMEGLQTANAADAAMLSEGMEDRLIPMSVGVPAGYNRFTSWTLAAMRVAQMGSPMRRFGAMSGAQSRMQDEYVQRAGLNANPISRNSLIDSEKGLQTLERIAMILERIAGGGQSRLNNRGEMSSPSGRMNLGNDAQFNR